MKPTLDLVLRHIEEEYNGRIEKGARHYVEVSLADQARKLGLFELGDEMANAHAIVPLKSPMPGMKVRIDGRTFVNYAEYDSGVAVPAYLVKGAQRTYRMFVANDSMICNFH
jgi:hypothetical protein